MRAMIFAAGLGTRLKPLTNTSPKALIKIKNKPMLQWVILNLIAQGISEIIINVHHFPDKIIHFLKQKDHFGIHIEYSYEKNVLLDTGGALKKAAWFFDKDQPFLVYNTDIISDMDINQMLLFHQNQNADITLAVRNRPSNRYFLFDQNYKLSGWINRKENKTLWVRREKEKQIQAAFSGIHILSGRKILDMLTNEAVFSIIPEYIRLASTGLRIFGFQSKQCFWHDLGTKEKIIVAENTIPESFFNRLEEINS